MRLKTILEELYQGGMEPTNQEFMEQKLELENKMDVLMNYLKTKRKILLLTCSNRTKIKGVDDETPKSTMLAYKIRDELRKDGIDIELIEVPTLKILPCEGNVSRHDGNNCGALKSKLDDKYKNPTGFHRCWASVNDTSDELWKVTKQLFESDCVLFFASVRWGQANMYYQNLIERLTWIENIHSSYNEPNVVSHIDAGFICLGQNWNGENVVTTQKDVLSFYGFKTPPQLFFNWQYTENPLDETQESYAKSRSAFNKIFDTPKQILYKGKK